MERAKSAPLRKDKIKHKEKWKSKKRIFFTNVRICQRDEYPTYNKNEEG
jgi:hypothetical protein